MTKNVFDTYASIVAVAQRKGPKSVRLCNECKPVFDLTNDVDAEEWYYGHDCEEGQ